MTAVGGAVLPRLWVVTRGTQAVSMQTVGEQAATVEPVRVAVAEAPLWGLARVVAQEHPGLQCTVIDLDPIVIPGELDRLLAELMHPDGEDQLAHRGDQRLAARLVRRNKATAPSNAVLRPDGTYLLTGGLGDLGLLVAGWLVGRGARNVVLLGRSDPGVEAGAVIAELEQGGARVLVARADVTHESELVRALKELQSELPPVCGVIHAAGMLDDGILMNQSWERFAPVLAPKVQGAWNLHRLTRDLPLDFFVLFSSAASLLGSPGQGNYAAANAFLDALAHHRRGLGLPALSINWGPWPDDLDIRQP